MLARFALAFSSLIVRGRVRKSPPLLRRTLAEMVDGNKPHLHILGGIRSNPRDTSKEREQTAEKSFAARNKRDCRTVVKIAASVAFKLFKGMTNQ